MRNLFSTIWILLLTSFVSFSVAGSLFGFSMGIQKADDVELVDASTEETDKDYGSKTKPESDKGSDKKGGEPVNLGKELAKALFGKYLK